MLYHYTKLSVLKDIVKKDFIDFRATYFTHFGNDDYSWIKERAKLATKELCLQNGEWFDIENLGSNPYILSFCKDKNSQFMWEKYGDNNKGIKLSIDESLLNNHLYDYGIDSNGKQIILDGMFETVPCTYIDETQDLMCSLEQASQNANLDTWDYDDKLRLLSASLKRKNEFEKENEIRHICLYSVVAIVHPDRTINNDPQPTDKYLHLFYPKNIIKGIEVGYMASKAEFDEICKYVRDLGYNHLNEKNIVHQKSIIE